MKVTLYVEELDGIWILEASQPLKGLGEAFFPAQAKRRAFPTKEMLMAALPQMLDTAMDEAKAKEAGPGARS